MQIRSDADEKYLQDLADEVSERYKSLKGKGRGQDQDFKTIAMVAIVLLDELTQTKKSCESIREKAKQLSSRIVEKIDKLLEQSSQLGGN